MNPRIPSLFVVTLLALAHFSTAAEAAGSPPKTEIKPDVEAPVGKRDEKLQEIQVTLFGQPCSMSGPYTRPSLSLLHEISPEKIPPDLTVDQMKRIRTKTGDLKGMPMPIEQYRDHLRKRLSAKIAFEEAITQAKKSKDSRKSLDPFLTNLKEHIPTLQYPGFSETTKKAFETAGGTWTESFIAPLRERFESMIQPDTEEEFHKAIRAARIQYVCAFDDSDHHTGGEGEE